MLREMKLTDIPQVVEIHKSSWSRDEISVKLGFIYLQLFYQNIVQSQYSFGYVYVENGSVFGYASGFYDYQSFNKSFRNRAFLHLLVILARRLSTRKICLTDIKNLWKDNNKLRNAKYPKYHLGALAVANEYKGSDTGKIAITQTIGAVLNELKRKGLPGCWGLCDVQNIPMRKYLLRFGFEEADRITFIGKRVVLYEKTFNCES
jgi:hypothetical protein